MKLLLTSHIPSGDREEPGQAFPPFCWLRVLTSSSLFFLLYLRHLNNRCQQKSAELFLVPVNKWHPELSIYPPPASAAALTLLASAGFASRPRLSDKMINMLSLIKYLCVCLFIR